MTINNKKIAIFLSFMLVFTMGNACNSKTADAAQSTVTSTVSKANSLPGIKKIKNNNINAIILGDSIAVSQGASSPLTSGWDSILNSSLAKTYSNNIIWNNKASSGTLVDYCLKRVQEITDTTDVVFICVGRNDRNYYTPNQFTLKYTQLIRSIQRKAPNADIFCIVEPPMVSTDESLFMGIRSSIIMVANNTGANLLDVWSAFPTDQTALADLLSDGLHPKDKGYKQMSSYIYDRLVSIINSVR